MSIGHFPVIIAGANQDTSPLWLTVTRVVSWSRLPPKLSSFSALDEKNKLKTQNIKK